MKPIKDRLTVIKQSRFKMGWEVPPLSYTTTPKRHQREDTLLHQQRGKPPHTVRGGIHHTPAERDTPKRYQRGISPYTSRGEISLTSSEGRKPPYIIRGGYSHMPSEGGKPRENLLYLKNRLHFPYTSALLP